MPVGTTFDVFTFLKLNESVWTRPPITVGMCFDASDKDINKMYLIKVVLLARICKDKLISVLKALKTC